MGAAESKSHQLRVRVTEEERERLEQLIAARGQGETISDLVREAISLLLKNEPSAPTSQLSTRVRTKIERLALLLKREPQQVEEACIEGIFDLIESKCAVPLLIMETKLHLKYRNHDEKQPFPWNEEGTPSEDVASET